ncbi:MAG: rhomboid family intramembrane serine protease [Chitinophagaceae bacterium]|jgi:membrane associated rhomboid family serine protease|nr:rhomboid family intramembrane serine protease [Chitinophagaceae bacterium]HQV60997.1 rhomboid family intramembrane serine protease [Chitinophagaceae bacterium]HQV86788.1 rhomboid family intramembrane serine protease [Chitinophagaceae bacterium]HQX72078.1 rhomboid family intramembrane serine protease [Chitinophagaceae bacterium]HQZ75692.1 rhomboid family intramembrane serine protease [Chitinophagaceae bacterium]
MELSITLIIIIITVIISFSAFSNQKIIDDLIFYPPAVTKQNQWYRFITCGLIHADVPHLIFNMFSLYMFGEFVERSFASPILFAEKGKFMYLGMYIIALFVCLIPTFIRHRNDYYYRSLGASGAVSAVVFAGILFDPTAKLGFFFIPPIIPGYIFGPVYLIASTYLEKQAKDNVNHSAHIWGALFGIGFIIAAAAILKTDYQPAEQFVWKIRNSLGF